MDNIHIDYTVASKTGSDIQTLATEIKNILTRVSGEMEKIDGEAWKSTKAAQFRSEFEALRTNFDKVYEAISSMGGAINKTARIYDEDGSTTASV